MILNYEYVVSVITHTKLKGYVWLYESVQENSRNRWLSLYKITEEVSVRLVASLYFQAASGRWTRVRDCGPKLVLKRGSRRSWTGGPPPFRSVSPRGAALSACGASRTQSARGTRSMAARTLSAARRTRTQCSRVPPAKPDLRLQ